MGPQRQGYELVRSGESSAQRAGGVVTPKLSVLDLAPTGRGAHPYVTPAQARAREWTADERHRG